MQTNKTPKVIKLSSVKSNNSFIIRSNSKNEVMSINNNITDDIIDNLAALIKD